MRAVNLGTATLRRGAVSTGHGAVLLESRYEAAVESVIRALNAYDALVVVAEWLLRGGMQETIEHLPEIRAAARDALMCEENE